MQQSSFTFELNSISDFLRAPKPSDPFSENEMLYTGESAVERMKRQLRPGPLPPTLHITLLLPANQITPDLPQKVRSALDRFCLSIIQDNQNEQRLKRFKGLRASIQGLIFLAVCLFISALFASHFLSFIPPFLDGVFSEGFNIIGWIALWHPVEGFLYDNAPLKHENDLLHLLQRASIVIQPSPKTS